MSEPLDVERPADARLASAYEHCLGLLRQYDSDRFFAGLFAPADKRPHLAALYAFSLDVARVRERAAQPPAGEIRLQWWRDALEGAARGDVNAHPIAAALLDTLQKFRLPHQALLDLVTARSFDLYDDPMPSVAALEGYCGETASALFRLASFILAEGNDPGGADAAGHAGVAYALTGLLRAFPWHARAGQLFVPIDLLAKHGVTREDIVAGKDSVRLRAALADMRGLARHHLAASEAATKNGPRRPALNCALLPTALVPLYLRRMERHGYDPFHTLVAVPQWRAQWRIWRAAGLRR